LRDIAVPVLSHTFITFGIEMVGMNPWKPATGMTALAALPLILSLAAAPAMASDPGSAVSPIPTAAAHGLDGMAPAGRWAARLTVLRNSYDHRYDNASNRVDMDADYNAQLATAGFPVTLDTRMVTEFTELLLGYGVTENLTVGAILPYARTRNTVRVRESAPGGSAALQGVLTGVLGYDPLGSTQTAGMADPTLGALWRFHKGRTDSAIAGFGVRFGVARDDDPHNLADVPPGDGSTDLRFRVEYFRDLGRGWDLRLLAEHQVQLPDEIRARPGNPLTTPAAATETLKRDLGDYQEFDLEVGKSWGDWRASLTWHRYPEASDRYTSSIGTDTSFLNTHTHTVADQARYGVTWSGIRAWQAGKLPLPLIVKLEVQDAVAGRTFVDVRDVYLRVTSFF